MKPMMSASELVRRALGVPGVIAEENQDRAAAAALVRLVTAKFPSMGKDWPGGQIPDKRLDDFQSVVGAVTAAIRRHDLDPILGGYAPAGVTTTTFATEALQNATWPGDDDEENLIKMADTLTLAVAKFVWENPHLS